MSVTAQAARRRRRLLLWTSPLVVLGVVTGSKLLSMTAAAEVARTAVVLGNPEDALRASQTMLVANVVDPYKAPFAAGTATAAAATTPAGLREAEALLREALALAEGTQTCAVRYNLALVLEAQGDATSDPAAAAALFDAARAVADAAPDACDRMPSVTSPAPEAEPSPQPEEGAGADAGEGADAGAQGAAGATAADDLDTVATRTSSKAGAARDGAGGQPAEETPPPDDAEGTPVPVDDRQAALDQRLTDAVHEQQARDGDGAGGAQGGETVPAPW